MPRYLSNVYVDVDAADGQPEEWEVIFWEMPWPLAGGHEEPRGRVVTAYVLRTTQDRRYRAATYRAELGKPETLWEEYEDHSQLPPAEVREVAVATLDALCVLAQYDIAGAPVAEVRR